MSKEAKKVESNISIVRRIVAFLQLGEAGKLDSFFLRVEKTLKREVEGLKKNIDVIEFEAKQKDDKYKDRIEDAEADVEAAFLNVAPEQVDTNEKASQYQDRYLSGIRDAKRAVKSLEDKRADVAKEYKGQVDDLKDQIKSLNETKKSIIG